MNTPSRLVASASLLLLGVACQATSEPCPPINTVVGDVSFVETFGYPPDARTSSQVRVETHLHYIEERLRAVDTAHLTDGQRARRLARLEALHAYHGADGFPVNDDHPDARRPTFISDNGHVCAVGALLPDDLVQALNRDHKYDYLRDIHEPALERWADDNGFTLDELAMIQPGYNRSPHQTYCDCRGLGLSPSDVALYRAQVEGRLSAARAELASCVRGAPVQVHFDVAHSGQAFRVRSGASATDACLKPLLSAIRFPTSCQVPSRAMRLTLRPDATMTLAYATNPAASSAAVVCDTRENPSMASP